MAPYDILHWLEHSEIEGTSIAKIVAALAGHLDPDRYRIHAWFRRGQGPLARMLTGKGVTVQCLENDDRGPAGMWQFAREMRHHRFDIVHQHAGGRAVRLVSRLAGARVITHLHDRGLQRPGEVPVRFRSSGADMVVATSQAVAAWAGRHAQVAYPGVDAPARGLCARDRTSASRVLGAAGRLAPLKGFGFLLRALPLVRRRVPDITLEIAGAGPEEASLRREAHRLGLDGCIRFLGWQEHVPFHRWNVFVMPSLEEPFGMAALEAMAAGLPVVASSVGGLCELIEDGRSGWLVPPADPEALALRLIPLLQHAGEQEEMGRAARQRAELFSTRRLCERIEELYERLLTATD